MEGPRNQIFQPAQRIDSRLPWERDADKRKLEEVSDEQESSGSSGSSWLDENSSWLEKLASASAAIPANFLGGLAQIGESGLSYLAAAHNAAMDNDHISGMLSQNNEPVNDAVGNMLLGGADLFNKAADAINSRYGVEKRYEGRDFLDLATDTEFLTNPRGAAAAIANGLGTSIPFIATSMIAPEITLPTRALQAAQAIPILGRSANFLLNKGVGSYLDKTGAALAINTPVDAALNSAEIYKPLKEQGYTDKEIFDRMNMAALEETPMDLLSNAVLGGVVSGNLSRMIRGNRNSLPRKIASGLASGALEIGSEGLQEQNQTRVTNKYSNQPYGTLLEPEASEEWARTLGMFGSGGPAVGGAVRDIVSGDGDTFTVSDEVTDPNVTSLTEQKMRLLDRDYFDRFNRHLFVTSMSRNGNGDSWHDSGQAFDTADDILETSAEAREWLINQAAKYGLYALDEYEHPSEHATGGHIHFSDHGEEIDGIPGETATGQDPNFTDRENEAWQEAQWVESQTGIPAEYIYRQWAHESTNFTSRLARENNNFGGLTQSEPNGEDNKQPDGGNYYREYKDFHDYAQSYVKDFINLYDGKENVKSMEDFVSFLYDNGYFTGDPGDYLASMKGVDVPSTRGGYSRAGGGSSSDTSQTNQPQIDTYDEDMNSMYEGFAKFWQNLYANKADQDFFGGLFDSDGKFNDTEENRAAIKERVEGDLAEPFQLYRQIAGQANTRQAQQETPKLQQETPKVQQETSKIEAKTDNLDALKEKLGKHREAAIQSGDMGTYNVIEGALRSGDTAMMKQVLNSLPALPETASQKGQAESAQNPVPQQAQPQSTQAQTNGQYDTKRLWAGESSPVNHNGKSLFLASPLHSSNLGDSYTQEQIARLGEEAKKFNGSVVDYRGNTAIGFENADDSKRFVDAMNQQTNNGRQEHPIFGQPSQSQMDAAKIRNAYNAGMAPLEGTKEGRKRQGRGLLIAARAAAMKIDKKLADQLQNGNENAIQQVQDMIRSSGLQPTLNGFMPVSPDGLAKATGGMNNESTESATPAPTQGPGNAKNQNQNAEPGQAEEEGEVKSNAVNVFRKKAEKIVDKYRADKITYQKAYDTLKGNLDKALYADSNEDTRNALMSEFDKYTNILDEIRKEKEGNAASEATQEEPARNETPSQTEPQKGQAESAQNQAQPSKKPAIVRTRTKLHIDGAGVHTEVVSQKEIPVGENTSGFAETKQEEPSKAENITSKEDFISDRFGSKQENAEGLLEAFGKPAKKFVNVIDDSDEALEKALSEFDNEIKKLSSNPMFNPNLMMAAFKVGAIYLQRGTNKFAAWAAKMTSARKEMKPFLPAVWSSLNAFPSDTELNETQMTKMFAYVGTLYDQGMSKADIKKDVAGLLGDGYDSLVDSAYAGVEKYPSAEELKALQEVGENAESGKPVKSDSGREGNEETDTGRTKQVQKGSIKRGEGVSERSSTSEGTNQRVEESSSKNGQEVSEDGNSEGIRAGVSGKTGRPENEASGRGMGSSGRKRGGEQGYVPVGRGGRQLGGEGRPDSGGRSQIHSNGSGITNNENYHIEDASALLGGTPKVRFARNQKAIEVFKELQATNRQPTQEEKDIMAAYTGWGSFAQELFQGTYENPRPKEGWEKESEWLRDNLDKEEWEAARNSTINAHYTSPSVVKAIWDMVRRMGFTGGRVLEPSMGVGNFFGMMPKDMEGKSALFGVEMDSLTGGIAKLLYPNANIRIAPYQNVQVADGTYDLIVGNVPFSDLAPADRRYDKFNATLHDYFFLKGIDELRPGGIMIAITSKGTMDKKGRGVRLELAKKAELIDAYRFPTGAFKDYAGTEVVTDVLVFRKRENPVVDASNEEWIGTKEHEVRYKGNDYTYNVNNFFENHPEKVLGEVGFGNATGKQPGLNVAMDKENFQSQLDNMARSVEENAYKEAHYDKNLHYVSNNANDRLGTLQEVKGKLYIAQGLDSKPINASDGWKLGVTSEKSIAARIEELKDLVKLRKAYARLEDAEKSDSKDLEKLRKELKAVYDAHVAKYLTDKNGNRLMTKDKKTKKQRVMVLSDTAGLKLFKKYNEPNYFNLSALMRKDGKPAKILTERVMRAAKKDIKNPTVREALMLQRNQSMRIDVGEIARIAHKSVDEVLDELGDTLFKTPTGEYQVRDQYLSGNVRKKLREAKAALANGDKDMERNIKVLQEVMPDDIPYYNITVSFGGTWIDLPYYQQFISELVGGNAEGIEITRTKGGAWKVSFANKALNDTAAATTTYGVQKVKFDRLLTHALNHTTPNITFKDENGNVHKDEEAIKKATEQIEKIRDTFNDWIWKDEKRKLDLAHTYNEVLNNTATPSYDGSFLDMVGMMLKRGENKFNLRKHQINAIYRGLVNGRGIYAHEVGTGKTYTMGGLAMESRRFGLARKPLILAHNANSRTVANEIQEMYPGAKILYISGNSKDVKGDLMRVKTDDWDVVVMPHSKVDQLTLTEDTLKAMTADIIAELEDDAYEEAKNNGIDLNKIDLEDEKEIGKIRNQTVKDLVKQRLKILENIRKNAFKSSAEDAIPFEDLGIDMVIVDESHMFKKPPFSTRMNVKGLQKGVSQRSTQLNFITQYIQGLNNGRGVHLFTGTPITNTVVEMYHNMKYVMPNEMKEAGVYHFDDWFNAFAQVTSNMEYSSTGETENVDRLNAFVNVAELRRMVGQFMDIVFSEDMPEFEPRKTESGKTLADNDLTKEERDYLINGRDENPKGLPYVQTINEVIPMNDAQKGILSMFIKYAKQWKNATKLIRRKIMKEQQPQSPLYTENAVHKAAMDVRMYNPDINVTGMDSKEARCVKNVLDVYNMDKRTTQCIMLEQGRSDFTEQIPRDDRGYPVGERTDKGAFIKEKVRTYNLVKGIKEGLIKGGIPENEIATVDGSTSAEKKAELAEAVKEGTIRVIIGSTDTLGTGVNMQDNLKAIHHIDAPWMPGELAQRNGRIERQGNKWNTVLEYRYITEKLDGRRWQVLATKKKFIKMFMKADENLRVLDGDAVDVSDENGSGTNDFEETLSKATGDPRFLRKANLEQTVQKLEKAKASFVAGIEDAKYKLSKLKGGKLDEYRDNVQRLKSIQDKYGKYKQTHGADNFEITINGKTYNDRQTADAAIAFAFKKIDKVGVEVNIGEFAGLSLYGYKEGTFSNRIRITDGEKTIFNFDSADSVAGITQKLSNTGKAVEKAQDKLDMAENDVKTLEKQVKDTFPREKVLNAKSKELDALIKDLQENPVPPPQWLVEGAPMQADVTVDGKKGEVAAYRVSGEKSFSMKDGEVKKEAHYDSTNPDSFYVGVKLEGTDEVKFYPWQEIKDSQGLPMITAPDGVKESKAWEKLRHDNMVKEATAMFEKGEAPAEEEAEEKTSSNRKYSLDNSDNLRYNKEKVVDIKSFRNKFNPTTLRTWGNNHVTFSEQKDIFDNVFKETGKMEGELNSATNQADIDSIREKMRSVLQEVVLFNEGGVLQSQQAVRVRIAREAFEHHEQVIRARVRVGKNDKNLNQPAGNHGVRAQVANESHDQRNGGAIGKSSQELYGNVFNVSGERDDAEKHYRRLYDEQYESDKKLHPNEFVAEHSDNQGALSSAKHFSIDGKPIVGVRKYSTAWHGSPHKFDTFTLEAIGTGEGAQVHGWGLYFAKERSVSEWYRKMLAGTVTMPTFDEIVVGGQTLEDMLDDAIDNGDYKKQAMLENYETYDRDGVLKSAKEEGFDQEYIDWFNRLADKVEKQLPEKPGSLFQVEIPDEDVMLDEQKKLVEQSDTVWSGIQAINDFLSEDIGEKIEFEDIKDLTGKEFYDSIVEYFIEMKGRSRTEAPRLASELLNEWGIKGITYMGGRDGRCYVVFDDQAIEIIQRLSVAKGKASKRSMDELKAEVKEAFPGAKVQESGNKLTFTMPNGQKVTVSLQENITVNEQEEAAAKASHGFDQSASVTIEGYAETVGAEGFIALSQGSREGTGFHEAYHIAEAIAFTKRELEAAKRLISANEEERANAYAKWKLERKKGNNFAKLWQKISDFAVKMAGILGFETKHNLFRKVSSGEIYERKNEGMDVERKYSVNPSDNSNPSLFQKIKNFLSGAKPTEYRHRKMMADLLGKALNLSIRSGKISDSKGNVIYKESARVIRSKHMYDWDNILPVAGSVIAERLGIVKKASQTTEAMRNYIASWILTGNPNNTSKEAKTFQEAMQRNPFLADSLMQVREAFEEWRSMDAKDKMRDAIQMTKQQKTNWRDVKNHLYDQFFEELGPVERMIEDIQGEMAKKGQKLAASVNPMVAFRLSRGSFGRAIAMIEGRGEAAVDALRTNFPNVNFDGFKTLHDILKDIGALQNIEKQRDFVTYCTACHVMDMHKKNRVTEQKIDSIEYTVDELGKKNKELAKEKADLMKRLSLYPAEVRRVEEIDKEIEKNNKIRKKGKSDIEALEKEIMPIPEAFTQENCEKYIRDGKQEYDQAQKDIVRFSNVSAAILADSGVISQKRYRELLKSWPNYVPMFRVFEENEDIDFGDSMKHIKGSMRDIINPLESIIRNTTEFVRKAEKNKAKCLLANLARCDGSGMLLEEVDNAKPNDKTTITFYEDGDRKYLQTDPSVVDAVNRMDMGNSNSFVSFFHSITKVARACFTMVSPEFATRNIFRDYGDLTVYNKYGFVSPMDILRAFMHAFTRDRTYYEWLSSGAAISSAVSLDRNYTQEMINKLGRGFKKRLLSREFPQALLEGLQKFGEYSEYATRIAMYEKAKKHLTTAETKQAAYEAILGAAFESRDLMDFSRHGKAGETWNKFVPFANANLQGMNKFYRTCLDPKGWRDNPKQMARAMARLVLTSVLPAALLFLLHRDDDWYKEAPEWLKESHWLFYVPGVDTIIRIPKGSDVGIRFLSNAVEKGMASSYYNEPLKFKELMMPLWDALPNFTVIAILPILEASLNKSTFTGRAIVPQYQEKMPEKLQYGPYTTGFAKFLGEKLGVAPSKIDHVISGYTGSIGMFPLKTFDILAGDRQLDTSLEEMPLTRALTYMPYKNPRSVQKFYELLDEQTKLENEYKMTGVRPDDYDPSLLKQLKGAKKELSKLSKQEKDVIDNKSYNIEDRKSMQMDIQNKRISIVKRVLGE